MWGILTTPAFRVLVSNRILDAGRSGPLVTFSSSYAPVFEVVVAAILVRVNALVICCKCAAGLDFLGLVCGKDHKAAHLQNSPFW